MASRRNYGNETSAASRAFRLLARLRRGDDGHCASLIQWQASEYILNVILRLHQVGAAFKLKPEQREGCKLPNAPARRELLYCRLMLLDTDFLSTGGLDGYTWNVIRSESDHIMLQHARKSGAKVYEGIKVTDVVFRSLLQTNGDSEEGSLVASRDRPVSASWSSEQDGTTGTLDFDYLVDASGRAGLLNGYTKNRTYNKGLKNVASWAYWNNTGIYASGTARANSPLFEALIGV
ncbi:MAG: hypothetical protein Q9207_007869 [Kuettlingeria erythrocarpa]